MIKQSLIISWAEALFQVAIEKDKLLEYEESIGNLLKIFNLNEEAITFLANGYVDLKVRNEFLDLIFKNKIDDHLLNGLKLLIQRNLFSSINDILIATRKRIQEELEVHTGVIFSTIKLDEKTIRLIEEKIYSRVKRKIKLENKIDPNLLAGIRIEILNKKYDFSLKGKIDDMKSMILANRN